MVGRKRAGSIMEFQKSIKRGVGAKGQVVAGRNSDLG